MLNRLVVVATPLHAGLGAWVVGWTSTHLPGLPALHDGPLAALMACGALAATAASLSSLQASQRHQAAQDASDAFTRRLRHHHGIDHA
jgi:hypothetical protein